jgi:multiple antibiotic resistance protein
VDTGSFGQALVILLLVLDPLGDIPVFAAVTSSDDGVRRTYQAYLASAIAAAAIVVAAVAGDVILDFLGVSLEALLLSGGIVLLLAALEMLRGRDSLALTDHDAHIALVPLGTPTLAGPAAVVATIVLMRQNPVGAGRVGTMAGLAAALICVALALRLAPWAGRYLRPASSAFLTKIVGLLLLAVAVQLMVQAAMRWVRLGLG